MTARNEALVTMALALVIVGPAVAAVVAFFVALYA